MKLFNDLLIKFPNSNPYEDQKGQFAIDTRYDPVKHVRTKGEVYSTPAGIHYKESGAMIGGYGDEYNEVIYYMSDIVQEVEVGDTVHLRRQGVKFAIDRNHTVTIAGEKLYRIPYNFVIAAERNSEIIPIGGYILIEPDMESWDDILLPVFYNPELTGGKMLPKPKDQWIQTKVEPEAKALRGYVRHVGTPLKGDHVTVQPGDHVIFDKGVAQFERDNELSVKIQGKKYYYIQHRFVLGTITKPSNDC